MMDRRAFFGLLPGVAAAVAAKGESAQIPPEVIRRAWVEGSKAQRKKYRELTGSSRHFAKSPEETDFAGTEYEAGMRAATEVILAWIAAR